MNHLQANNCWCECVFSKICPIQPDQGAFIHRCAGPRPTRYILDAGDRLILLSGANGSLPASQIVPSLDSNLIRPSDSDQLRQIAFCGAQHG
jgi:hypothetical protein